MKNFALLLVLIVLIVGLSNIARLVDNSNGIPDVMTRLFPEKFVNEEDQQALDTGVAPFEQNGEQQVFVPNNTYTVPTDGSVALKPVDLDTDAIYDPLGEAPSVTEELDIAHRHEAAVNTWVTEAVSEILNFGLTGYEQHKVNIMVPLMSANAISEFEAFMQSSNILQHMQANNLQMKSFVTDMPLMRTSGPVSGRYRWLYDLPVNLTFLPATARTYDDLEDGAGFQQESLRFRVQVGRVAQGGTDGMVIETWEALPGAAQ